MTELPHQNLTSIFHTIIPAQSPPSRALIGGGLCVGMMIERLVLIGEEVGIDKTKITRVCFYE